MFTREIPLQPSVPELIDPNYANRIDIVERARRCLPVRSGKVISIGSLVCQELFSSGGPGSILDEVSGLDFSVNREAGRAYYELDECWHSYAEAIEKIATHEHSTYPDANHMWAQVTVDTRELSPIAKGKNGNTQRSDC